MAKRQLKKARIGVNYFESSFCGSYSCCQSAKMMQAVEDDLFTIMGLRKKESRRASQGVAKGRIACHSFTCIRSLKSCVVVVARIGRVTNKEEPFRASFFSALCLKFQTDFDCQGDN